jgi:hypothetical protein
MGPAENVIYTSTKAVPLANSTPLAKENFQLTGSVQDSPAASIPSSIKETVA